MVTDIQANSESNSNTQVVTGKRATWRAEPLGWGPQQGRVTCSSPSWCFKEWGQDCFCFLWSWGWTQSLLLSEHPTTKLNFSPLTTFFFFETGSCEVAQVTLNLLYSQSESWTSNPSSCLASWAARITGLCPQAWLNFLFFLRVILLES